MIKQSPNTLAELLLLAVKMEDDYSPILLSLESMDIETFSNSIDDDNKKKAFWVNIYNASYQILRKEHNLVKPAIYKNKAMVIAGERFSLDDIEHSILRKNKVKFSFGLLKNIFAKAILKKLEVNQLDYRIHFALNCGAKSCPPIAFYNHEKINAQLDQATQSFLEGETDFDHDKKILRTTALFKWFSADFGGPKGIRAIYKQQLNKDVSEYKIYYKNYSWEDDLANFVS